MLLTYQHNSLFIFSLAATCCLFSGTRASLPDARNKNNTTSVIKATGAASPAAPPPYECNSMDIRNHCTEFTHLENCTVITGYLIIVLLQSNDTCDYSQYRFPKLREITDFLLIYEVKNLTSIKHMFPNLTVIRGLKLFLNYALGITRMHELQTVEFPSLVAIQRGHVLIGSNPKLCFLNMTNFDRLTLTTGENHIFPSWEAVCSPTAKCLGCVTGYCWSNMVCQKFENDNIINYQQGIQHCNAQCLGGCYNRTAQGCAVCRSWTDHGTCVEECPADKYASEHFLRCYTREECIDKKLMIYKQTCVAKCPSGYKLNNATHECDSCGGVNNCTRICNPHKVEDPFWVYSLRDVEDLKGCQICNASVVINLRNRINEQELFKNLGDIKEIVGHLKVYQSPHLTTLSFFKKLEKIHGTPLENQHYSLIVYNNRKLRYLWPVKSGGLQLVNGGMYLHANGRLCNRVIREFKNAVKHDSSFDSLQTSDQEVLCSPAKLHLNVEVLSHRALKFTWPKDETSEEVEIIYKPIATDKSFVEQSELDTNVCERINWQRELKFAIELPQNASHYTYTVDNLEPHTKYACLVKTFGKDDSHEARSEMTFVTTQIVIPPPPIMKISKKSFDSLTVHMYYENREDKMVDFYMLEVYEIGDRKDIVDQRDYCADAMKPHADYRNEDYEECCTRRLEEAEDDIFKKQLQKEFGCSSDNKEYCGINSLEDNINPNALLSKRLEHSETNYTIRSLERFQLYAIQVKACNHAGCGSFNILNERTNYSLAADKIYDLTACKMPHNNEYRVHFKEPEKPNGIITAYTLHFRNFEASSTGEYDNHLHCITRREHERNRFMYVGYLKSTYNQAAVKVESFGHHTFTDWVAITPCTGVPSMAKTKLAGPSSHGWNIFFIFFSIGAGGTVLWVCYKRKYWRKLPELCRYLPPLHFNWRALRPESSTEEDRQILVDDFETVRFHNSAEEDMKYLVH